MIRVATVIWLQMGPLSAGLPAENDSSRIHSFPSPASDAGVKEGCQSLKGGDFPIPTLIQMIFYLRSLLTVELNVCCKAEGSVSHSIA